MEDRQGIYEMSIEIEITDNTEEILKKFNDAIIRGLERMGLKAEDYASDLAPNVTGALRNSITHVVDTASKKVYIGTDIEYGPYVELGTGAYAEGGGGRPTPWVYQDSKGKWWHTRGQEPKPYLRPALKDHPGTYRNIMEDSLKNG